MRAVISHSCRFMTSMLFLSVFTQLSSSAGEQGEDAIVRDALVLSACPGYPEWVTLNDPVQASIVQGIWRAPIGGEMVRYNDTVAAKWEAVAADSQGWFEHRSLGNGYAYVAYQNTAAGVFILEAGGNTLAYVNGAPRSGNPYLLKDGREPWEPRSDYSLIPIWLGTGTNHLIFVCNRGRLKVRLWRPSSDVFFNARDLTLPDLIAGRTFDTRGAIVLVNSSRNSLKSVMIRCVGADNRADTCAVPVILPLSVRKVGFPLKGAASASPGEYRITLQLLRAENGRLKEIDSSSVAIHVVAPSEPRRETFVSSIDGSVQYFAVNPSLAGDSAKPQALFLSLHGAGVDALNQARSYSAKSWGTIVAPTNRRPFGYNWEDWGRLDATEVLDLAEGEFHVDPSRIYLTGHSMGGHGTYHVGSLYPDRFAAIGPSAGWISFWSYRVRHEISHPSAKRQMLMRGNLPSDTYALARNFGQLAVFILHGSADDNVPVEQSRTMAAHLQKFHHDFVYHEEPDAGHWWDKSDEPGVDCVDWHPLFDFFARHARPEMHRSWQVDFVTPNPGVSSRSNWVSIEAQERPLILSSVEIVLDPITRRYRGTTRNVARLSLDLSPLPPAGPVLVELDSQKVKDVPWPGEGSKIWLERRNGLWSIIPKPDPELKGPHRYGTFKDAIRNQVVFVYGTNGTEEENRWALEKARFDAERFWYQGNGSIDVVADDQFRADRNPDRNVVLYGNAVTNSAWKALLRESPVSVEKGGVRIGPHSYRGGNLSCLFIRPRPGSRIASVGVVGGTGIEGMRLNTRLPYFLPGVSLPDVMLCDTRILGDHEEGLRALGFFGVDWSVEGGEFVWGEEQE